MAADPASFDDGDDRVLSPAEALAEIARIGRRYRLDRFGRRAVADDRSPTDIAPICESGRGAPANTVQLVGCRCAAAEVRANTDQMVTTFRITARCSNDDADVVFVVWVFAGDDVAAAQLVNGRPVEISVGDHDSPSAMAEVAIVAVRFRVVPRTTCDRAPTDGGPASPRRPRRRSS